MTELQNGQERVFEAIQKSAGMETRPKSSGYVGRVSIPAALGIDGYKLGRDWRIPESAAIEWLHKRGIVIAVEEQ